MQDIIILIHRPYKYLNELGPSQDTLLMEFSNNFLKPTITNNIKVYLIPYLKDKLDSMYYDKLVRYLNSIYHIHNGSNIFYCMLALEPTDYGKYKKIFSIH